MRSITLLLVLASGVRADELVLFAGGGIDKENVPATRARLVDPFGIDFDKAGNAYIVELTGERVLKVNPKGILSIAAGTGKKGNSGDDGPAAEATFNGMHSLAIGPDGIIYLADTFNNRIRKLDPKSGIIAAFAGTGKKGYAGDGGPALEAEFSGVFSIAFDASGTKLYLADLGNRRIRAIDMKSGVVTTIAGNGDKGVPEDRAEAKSAPLVDPRAVAIDRKGRVYILERSGHALRVMGPGGRIRTLVGTGKAGPALGDGDPKKVELNGPKHVCVDREDNVIVADTANHRILKYSRRDERVTLLAGTGKKGDSGNGGPALKVALHEPHGVSVHPSGTLYIVDSFNHRVFRMEK